MDYDDEPFLLWRLGEELKRVGVVANNINGVKEN